MRIAVVGFLATMACTAETSFESQVKTWREEREARLKAPDGWLSVAGLFWLKEGRNEVGSAAVPVQLPRRAPARVGAFTLADGKAQFEAAPGVTVLVDGKSHLKTELRDDRGGNPSVVEVSGLKLTVIHRGKRHGIRLKDNDSEYRRNFRGLSWYPPRKDWVINASFAPHRQPHTIVFDLQTGDKQEMKSPGVAEFEYGGRRFHLTPVLEDGRLWFVFRDRTAGKATYPAARFLYADAAVNGRVILDFNKAYNPPCAFTPYSTCPLPPPENRLPIAVEAGELMYKGHQ